MKSKIKDLKISINKATTIHILNLFHLYFAKYLDTLSYKARKKEKFSILESLAKLLENKDF